ncbi:MAG: DUF4965 domain-containing protein [Clostridia bacterium]|nr:DUF4965 domain-containing protein [Clostridia bacterium]
MRLRAPAYPLITIDPNFSVWSQADKLTDNTTVHWTGSPNTILGTANIDGKTVRIIGADETIPAMKQASVDCNALSTTYVYEDLGVRLTLIFTSPVIPSDLYLLTRPVSYLEIKSQSIDGKKHTVSVKVAVSEEICMNLRGDDDVDCEQISLGKLNSVKMGRKNQQVLKRFGDDLRAEWGYFYLTSEGTTSVYKAEDGMNYVSTELPVKSSALITFAYDDIVSVEYFHKHLKTYWNKDGALITDEIVKAHADYKANMKRCTELSDKLFLDATRAGGEKYAELLELAFRQTIAAHKLAIDENGEILWISKECFSNGCAATVDVSYPSIPLFLLYNPELVKGMMRPIYKYAQSKEWKDDLKYDFAPHDAGRYPLLNGQVYGLKNGVMLYEKQMPVEECGNMLVMEAAVAIATKSTAFANEHMDILEAWVKYLIENGRDPENQLCTDDFAGHLAHNCNLSLKAIMGIAGLGIIYGMNGNKKDEKKYMKLARDMAADWAKRAANGDGSYRLAFDRPDTFSMKYNIVWDKLFGTEIMPKNVIESEFASYRKHMHAYGMPLDNRQPYTKSDWLVWTATLAESRDDFEKFVAPMWESFNITPSRVPMTDWYWTITSEHKAYDSHTYIPDADTFIVKSFRNRTVQGGLFMKLLEYKGIMSLKK